MHWPGGNFLLPVGFVFTAIGSLTEGSSFNLGKLFKPKLSKKEAEAKKQTYGSGSRQKSKGKTSSSSVFGRLKKPFYYIGFGLVGLGLLLRLQHLPGGNFFLVMGFPVVAIWYFLGAFEKDEN